MSHLSSPSRNRIFDQLFERFLFFSDKSGLSRFWVPVLGKYWTKTCLTLMTLAEIPNTFQQANFLGKNSLIWKAWREPSSEASLELINRVLLPSEEPKIKEDMEERFCEYLTLGIISALPSGSFGILAVGTRPELFIYLAQIRKKYQVP